MLYTKCEVKIKSSINLNIPKVEIQREVSKKKAVKQDVVNFIKENKNLRKIFTVRKNLISSELSTVHSESPRYQNNHF